MADQIYLNAHANECSAVVVERGQRTIYYQGHEYTMVGLYFGGGHDGERELFYILRPLDAERRGHRMLRGDSSSRAVARRVGRLMTEKDEMGVGS